MVNLDGNEDDGDDRIARLEQAVTAIRAAIAALDNSANRRLDLLEGRCVYIEGRLLPPALDQEAEQQRVARALAAICMGPQRVPLEQYDTDDLLHELRRRAEN